MLTPPQQVISHIINSTVGLASTSSKQFRTVFRDAPLGEPDTLLCLCIKWMFKNGDFSEYYDDIAKIVKGTSLATYVDSQLTVCPELIKIILQNADNKSRKNKISIKKDEFSLCVGRGKLITYPFTDDMEEAATALAEYTKMLFEYPKYDIEFAFEGNYGLSRNMDLTQSHILLLSKLTPDLFAEKGQSNMRRERNGRLVLRMTRIAWLTSGIYYNAILDFFKPLRATVVVQGEQPMCVKMVTYGQALEHTLAHPGEQWVDDEPQIDLLRFSSRKERIDKK